MADAMVFGLAGQDYVVQLTRLTGAANGEARDEAASLQSLAGGIGAMEWVQASQWQAAVKVYASNVRVSVHHKRHHPNRVT